MMRKFWKSKKGLTLVELIVVLAVTTIISVSVTSLLVAVQKQSDKTADKNQMLVEVVTAEEEIRSWYSAFDKDGVTVDVTESQMTVAGGYYLSFADSTLKLKTIENKDETVKFTYVVSIRFEKDDSTSLVKCTINYENRSQNIADVYVFILNKNVA